MKTIVKVAPPNSLIFISDINGGIPPIPVRDAQILSTPSCISVACYPEQDGKTEISIGSFSEVGLSSQPALDGILEVPSGTLSISTVDEKIMAKAKVEEAVLRVRIWLSHPRWPEKVTIALG